jgi:hypothetical protein
MSIPDRVSTARTNEFEMLGVSLVNFAFSGRKLQHDAQTDATFAWRSIRLYYSSRRPVARSSPYRRKEDAHFIAFDTGELALLLPEAPP